MTALPPPVLLAQATQAAEATSRLIHDSVLGAGCVLLGLAVVAMAVAYVRARDRHVAEVKAVQDQRVADHQARDAKQLEVITRCVETITKSTHVGEEQVEALHRLTDVIDKLGEDVRARRRP